MPPKKKVAAPIDRPLSRAYLREFAGWSTAYPPGLSDPTSLREMENILINRDGSARIRPGLRMISYREDEEEYVPAFPAGRRPVSSHEPFYLNDGRLAYLIAVQSDTNDRVEFCVGILDESGPGNKWVIVGLDAYGVSFDATAWPSNVDNPLGGPYFTPATTYVRFLQIDNKILALSNAGEEAIVFYVGATKKVLNPESITVPAFTGQTFVSYLTTNDWIATDQTTTPSVETSRVVDSLASSDFDQNIYNYALTYTFENDLGESAPAQLVGFKLAQPFGGWRWNIYDSAGAAGEASSPGTGGEVTDPNKACDQLILMAHPTAYATAVSQGATRVNWYLMAWSVQDVTPVEAALVAWKDISVTLPYSESWTRLTPASQPLNRTLPVPTLDNITNTSTPTRAGQGLVAADRLVLVNDPTAAAVIRWTTNESGNYLNFAASRGGGKKTLTSGNMQVPAAAKLWQNPQSADTITVLCKGTDGYSSAYYMAPATVTSQSDNTMIMGFEETTATPGTTSPYGCEVANNALYHPLDDQLMKSTASNYNINHKSQTDQIVNRWTELANKKNIVSCFFDQRLYFLVHNPNGEALELGAMGNEIWVLDLATTTPLWSRFLIQGVSLRKTMLEGRMYLSVTCTNGIYVLDEVRENDDYIDLSGERTVRNIPWRLETNVQGANRAHDAWSHLQQVSLTVGNFTGTMQYGIKGWDRHGMKIDKAKLLRYLDPAPREKYDIEDSLQVKRDMKEWYFYAGSVDNESGTVASAGQLNLVQYRYTPVSVNIGYEHGSVETFEYGRDTTSWTADRVSTNGIPVPFADDGTP